MEKGIRVRVWGPWACFTRADINPERVSYDAMTPSAARGILESIYWKPEMKWVVDRIYVLNPIKTQMIWRNEVATKGPAKITETLPRLDPAKERQQIATLALRDVEYIIEAHFEVVDGGDSRKHFAMITRRISKGQCYQRPFLGCREMPADFELLDSEKHLPVGYYSLSGKHDLGWMLHHIDYENDNQPHMYRAIMQDGVINVES